MTEEQLNQMALEAYPEDKLTAVENVNRAKRDGYIKALKETESLPKIKGWVARDEDGSVWFHYTKPHRNHSKGYWVSDLGATPMEIYYVEFPDLTWESEPRETELIIKEL